MPHTLLLADDSVTIQRVIELTFADEDIKVVAVSDGDQAIAQIDATPPDIVLADVGMPGKNGYEVAEYVKRSPRLSHIPVVLLTGAFEPVDQVKASAVGCDGVLAKPFEPQLVIGRVKELLARSGQPAAPVDANFPPAAPAKHWSPSAVNHALASTPEAASPKLDEYFDRLDAAFGNSWPGATNTAPADLPLSSASPPLSTPAPPVAPAAPTPPTAKAPTVSSPAPAPALADAFAALLAAEQNAPPPAAPGHWPSTTAAPPAITEDLVDAVARRVLERLSDRVVREMVGPTLSTIAERLVREEIERIKASIK